MIKQLSIPLNQEDISSLHVGDVVYLSGNVFTARDQAHQMLLQMKPEQIPFDSSSMGLYHCGPLMKYENETWNVISAGPTTSSRLDTFEPDFIDKFGISTIIGKGMMGEKTRVALKNTGVFFVFTGATGKPLSDLAFKVVYSFVCFSLTDSDFFSFNLGSGFSFLTSVVFFLNLSKKLIYFIA